MPMFFSRRQHGGVVPPLAERANVTREDARIHDTRGEASAALPPAANSPNITEPFPLSFRRKQRTKPLIAYLCRRFSPASRKVQRASSSSIEFSARQTSSLFAFVPVGSSDRPAPTPSPASHHSSSSPTSSESRSKLIDPASVLAHRLYSQFGLRSVTLQSCVQRDSTSEASLTLSEPHRDRGISSQSGETTDSSLEELQGLLDLRTWPQPLHVRRQTRPDYSYHHSTQHIYQELPPIMAYQDRDVSPISSPGVQTLHPFHKPRKANSVGDDDHRSVSPLSLDGENNPNQDTIYSIVDKYDDSEHVGGIEQPTPSTRILFPDDDRTAEDFTESNLPQLPYTWSRNSLQHGKSSIRQLTSASESEAEWQTVHSMERNSGGTESPPPLPSPLLPPSHGKETPSTPTFGFNPVPPPTPVSVRPQRSNLQAASMSSTVSPEGKGKRRATNREFGGVDNAGIRNGTLPRHPQQSQLFEPIRAIGNGLVRSPSLLKKPSTRPTGKTYIRTTSHNISSSALDLEKGLVQHAAPMGARPYPVSQYGSHGRDYKVGHSPTMSSRSVPRPRACHFSENNAQFFDHTPYTSRCHPSDFLETSKKPIPRRGNTYFDMHGSFPSLGSLRSAYLTDTSPTVNALRSSDAVPEESVESIALRPMPQPLTEPPTNSTLVCEVDLEPRSSHDRANVEQRETESNEVARRHHSFYYGNNGTLYLKRNDGTGYLRAAQLYLPAEEAPPLPDGSEEQKHAEKVLWFICILCGLLGPVLFGFKYGCFNSPMKKCINNYAVPNEQQQRVATNILWAWAFLLACAITAAAIGLGRLSSQ